LSNIGYTLEQQPVGKEAIIQVCGKMREVKAAKVNGKSLISKRIGFQIQDLLDMRGAGWTKKVFKAAAKTKEEIRLDAERDAKQSKPGDVKVHELVRAGERPAYLDADKGANGGKPGDDWSEVPKKTTRR